MVTRGIQGEGRLGFAMEVKGVLWDLDNTLIDFIRMKKAASDAAARAMVAAGADFPFLVDEAGEILFANYLQDIEGDKVFEAFLRQHHRQKIGLSQHNLDRITAAAVNAYLRTKLLHTEPFPGIRATLLRLAKAGIKQGVLTDAPRFKAYQRLEAAGILDMFDFVLTFSDTGAHKPEAGGFRTALDRFDLPPPSVVMVGDWPERDIVGAKSVGMQAAYAQYGRPMDAIPPEADVVLKIPTDLLRFVGITGI